MVLEQFTVDLFELFNPLLFDNLVNRVREGAVVQVGFSQGGA